MMMKNVAGFQPCAFFAAFCRCRSATLTGSLGWRNALGIRDFHMAGDATRGRKPSLRRHCVVCNVRTEGGNLNNDRRKPPDATEDRMFDCVETSMLPLMDQ